MGNEQKEISQLPFQFLVTIRGQWKVRKEVCHLWRESKLQILHSLSLPSVFQRPEHRCGAMVLPVCLAGTGV